MSLLPEIFLQAIITIAQIIALSICTFVRIEKALFNFFIVFYFVTIQSIRCQSLSFNQAKSTTILIDWYFLFDE